MMIPSPTASTPCRALASLDRAASPPAAGAPTPPVGNEAPDGGPDVVVTLGGARPGPASTYDATGRVPGGPSLNELGANGPASLVHASEALAVAPADDATALDSIDSIDSTATTPATGAADAGGPGDAGPA